MSKAERCNVSEDKKSMNEKEKSYLCDECVVKRYRDYYMYDMRGKRFVDCSLAEGHAVLGHKPKALHSALTQALSKGLWGTDPSREHQRASLSLQRYIAPWNFLGIFESMYPLATAPVSAPLLSVYGIANIKECMMDVDSGSPTDAAIWRPFSGIDVETLDTGTAFLISPIPYAWGAPLYALYGRVTTQSPCLEISSVLLAGINYIIPYLVNKGTGMRPLSHLAKNRKDIFVIDCVNRAPKHSSTLENKLPYKYISHTLALPSNWTRSGMYIVLPKYSPEEYEKVRQQFFERGFYLPPIKSIPISSPSTATQHELTSSSMLNSSGFSLGMQGIKYLPNFICLPAYMTKHEIAQWNLAIERISS